MLSPHLDFNFDFYMPMDTALIFDRDDSVKIDALKLTDDERISLRRHILSLKKKPVQNQYFEVYIMFIQGVPKKFIPIFK